MNADAARLIRNIDAKEKHDGLPATRILPIVPLSMAVMVSAVVGCRAGVDRLSGDDDARPRYEANLRRLMAS